jgi:hypothetical protein
MMNEETRLVFRGLLNLDAYQQQLLIDAFRAYERASEDEKQRIKLQEHVLKMELGPLNRACPCCGRS